MSKPNGAASDLFSDFLALTAADDTPDLYRKWAGIALIAGALERRVWTRIGNRGGQPRLTFPNLYTILVGPPGTGKYIIEDIQELWTQTTEPGAAKKAAFRVAPSNMTKASMVDALSRAVQSYLPPAGGLYEYNSLLIAAEELGVFLPTHDLEFIGVLNKLYNNPPVYSEERRHGIPKEVTIINPQLNILGGAQPGWLASTFPDAAWSMGLASRIILIYHSDINHQDPFGEGQDLPITRHRFKAALSHLRHLYGELAWAPAAQHRLQAWHLAEGPPTPTHSKLEHYCRRRTLHTIKLAIISSISRLHTVHEIELIDVDRAIAWLTEAEVKMPDVFRAMVGKSDRDVLEELHFYLTGLWKMAKGAPIHESRVYDFLSTRVPSDKVGKLIDVAERAGFMVRVAGTEMYLPKARAGPAGAKPE